MSAEDFARAINESIANREAMSVVEDFHEAYLFKNKPQLKREIDALNKNASIEPYSYEYNIAKEDIIARNTGDSYTFTRDRTMRTIKTASKLTKHLFDKLSKANDLLDIYEILGKDTTTTLESFSIDLPEGSLIHQDTHRLIWNDSTCINQVLIADSFDIHQYLTMKSIPESNSQSWNTRIKNFEHDKETRSFRYKKGYIQVFGSYETITREGSVILIESISTDNTAPSTRMTHIINDMIGL